MTCPTLSKPESFPSFIFYPLTLAFSILLSFLFIYHKKQIEMFSQDEIWVFKIWVFKRVPSVLLSVYNTIKSKPYVYPSYVPKLISQKLSFLWDLAQALHQKQPCHPNWICSDAFSFHKSINFCHHITSIKKLSLNMKPLTARPFQQYVLIRLEKEMTIKIV